MDAWLPQLKGPFTVKKQIAAGASSTVFSAINTDRGQSVAIKLFHAQLMNNAGFEDRLNREVAALKMVQHPNIVRLIDTWKTDQHFFLEMELVEGQTLKQWISENQIPWLEPKIWILAQIARALGAVHEEQIVHRDLKPDNILITPQGQIKLTDFGLARSELFRQQLTQSGALVGSLGYMAPESIEGKKASFPSDLFSFGVVAYEMLCGRHPFYDDADQLDMKRLLAVDYPSMAQHGQIPPEIVQLVESCLHKNEANRPTSIWQIESRFMEYLQRSGQLTLAKEWLAGKTEKYAEALQTKHSKLKTEISQAIERKVDRKIILSRINEFHALFPDAPEFPEMMASISLTPLPEQKDDRRGIYFSVAAGVTALITLTFVFMPSDSKPPEVGEKRSVAPVVVVPPPPPPAVVEPPKEELKPESKPEPVVASKAQAKKFIPLPPKKTKSESAKNEQIKMTPVEATGRLKLYIDSDARAYIDGRRVAKWELKSMELSAGTHTLVLEKEGFNPIERQVRIKPGKDTVVNATTEEQ